MNEQVAKARLKAVRKQMKEKGFDALVLLCNENLTYMTGFTGHESALVIARSGMTMVTDSRYTEQAMGECFACKYYEHAKGLAKGVGEVLARFKNIETVGLETRCSYAAFDLLKKEIRKATKAKVKPASGLPEAVRRTKNDDEAKNVQRAGKIAFKALEETLGQVRVGITEKELGGLLDFTMRKMGSQAGFETIMAFGPNCSRNHHQPGSRKLRKNDTILIDWGARYNSYTSDTTRSLAVGKVNKQHEKIYYAVLEANLAGIEACKPGASLREVDAACRQVLRKHDVPVFKHGTGHGLGLEVHEAPSFSPRAKGVLKAGDIVTIEPGCYIAGKMGVRIEDDVLITDKGHKVLTKDKGFSFAKEKLQVIKV
ncbi:putative peptidase [Anaerohalosphaera lusitana]|uniref:Putative peptidase n=1 Tax=Anaerohalosphaera lusitana TaxID=1936003 RepID=A0A1U9NGI5_9BACT|nr:Xaa-Pro peptidase family protein [Anaerohalosphaera lusitana]AQT67052.1 putative peptidase [Anaerohalosphaera lusitana]